MFFDKIGLLRSLRCRSQWGCICSKDWKITTEDFRAIQVIKFSFILMFWKENLWVKSWNIKWNFSFFSVQGCWGQTTLLFWKLVYETQMVKPSETTSHHNSRKCLICLPFTAIYFRSLYYETPCSFLKTTSEHYEKKESLRDLFVSCSDKQSCSILFFYNVLFCGSKKYTASIYSQITITLQIFSI